MEFKRILKRFMTGEDVLYLKKKLLSLGYLDKVTHSMFGSDTYKAVKNFQAANNLEVDGIAGKITWYALMGEKEPQPSPLFEIPAHIGDEARAAISDALCSCTEVRRKIVLEALKFAVDPTEKPICMRCFYVRGGNLYDTDLSLHKMTSARLKKYFSTKSYEPYYDNGRTAIMNRMAQQTNYEIPGADCSGFIVGLWRRFSVARPNFDAAANGLYGSYCTQVDKPQPGDLAWRSGHIGICVGGGYVVESAGGAYGVQLTKINNRKVWSFVDNKLHKLSAWSAFGDPKVY